MKGKGKGLLSVLSNEDSEAMADLRKFLDAQTILFKDVEQLSETDAVVAWSVIDVVEKNVFKDRKSDLREHLLDMASTQGEHDKKKGHYVYAMGELDATITAEKRAGKAKYDIEELKKVLAEACVDEDEVISYTPKIDQDALQRLILDGVIDAHAVAYCCQREPDSYALKVKKPKMVTKAIAGAKKE